MTSVERVVEYTELENEAAWETQKPPPEWPSHGLIIFDQVNFSYSSNGPLVLKDLTAIFRPKEKVSQTTHVSYYASIVVFLYCKSISMKQAQCYS